MNTRSSGETCLVYCSKSGCVNGQKQECKGGTKVCDMQTSTLTFTRMQEQACHGQECCTDFYIIATQCDKEITLHLKSTDEMRDWRCDATVSLSKIHLFWKYAPLKESI